MFEDVERAERRVAECIRRLAALHAGQSFAVVAQGRIITALYSYLLGRQLGKAEWLSLRSPDLSVIDLATWQVERGFFSQLQGTNDGRTEQ
jgi:broad specificity phosphatase PhoE